MKTKTPNMRRMRMFVLIVLPVLFIMEGCGLSNTKGQLTGVKGRRPWFHPQPYGTVYVPTGTFHMGQSDQDIIYALTSRPKQVSIQAFYMDDTEISNNEYRQFVYWVRDSIAKQNLGEDHLITNEAGEERLNWRERINYSEQETRDAIGDLYYQGDDKIDNSHAFDTRKFMYKYKWIDLNEAAKRKYLENPVARSQFIHEEEVPIYPDTLVWIRDFTYSYNEPLTQLYFWHPAYDDYPVVGVNWYQAEAFSQWRTNYLNSYYSSIGEPPTNDFRLPTEAEWEYAARGGRNFSPFPWGGPYTMNSKGCYLANFKPLRGNYIQDGGYYPVKVTSYFPNDFGLYCMAGNVAEWTKTAFDESLYRFVDDMNPHYHYNAKNDENASPTITRKVIRGGSWKDVSYYLQNGVRAYEYADTAKSYIGFRNAQTYMGRSINDR